MASLEPFWASQEIDNIMTIYKSTKTHRNASLQAKNTLGFTLIEFMVAIAILAILLAVALPSFSYWMAKNESDYVTDLLYRQMQGAREHAINHNRKVTLCGIDATGKCIDKAFTKLVIFIDDNKITRMKQQAIKNN
ncbi:MAG: prepilin-type N-terminal cleavage/methylation domain-containing protein [Marinagarivorans sp.]|nr:prepilin-type N-terminal cleavage/methylation domain-containing protein [Marinagarivorans sp.]